MWINFLKVPRVRWITCLLFISTRRLQRFADTLGARLTKSQRKTKCSWRRGRKLHQGTTAPVDWWKASVCFPTPYFLNFSELREEKENQQINDDFKTVVCFENGPRESCDGGHRTEVGLLNCRIRSIASCCLVLGVISGELCKRQDLRKARP